MQSPNLTVIHSLTLKTDQVGGARFVTKFDLLKVYWHVPLIARAKEISSFITPWGLFSYSVMPFGLRNAPATFERLMNRVLAGLEGCSAYLDDVVMFSDTWEAHVQRLCAVFDRLAPTNLTVNLAKCEFAKATVTYLGKVVGQVEVRPVQAKAEAILIRTSIQKRTDAARGLLLQFLS